MAIGKNMTLSDFNVAFDHVMSLNIASSTNVQMLETADQFANLLVDPSVRCDLFPCGYINVVYSAYEAIPQSAYDIWEQDKWISVGIVDGRPSSLAIVSAYPTLSATAFTIELFGYLDFDTVIAHCHLHFPQAKECLTLHERSMCMSLSLPEYCSITPYVELFRNQLKLSDGGLGVLRAVAIVSNHPMEKKAKFIL